MRSLLHNKWLQLLVILVLVAGIYLFSVNNYRFYKETILKVTNVTNKEEKKKEGVNGNTEQYYSQQVTGRVMNGKHKGEIKKFTNHYSYSQVFAEKYREGDRLFIHIKQDGTIEVKNVKRDNYIVLLILLLVISILITSKKKGFFTILSLVFNIIAFYLCLTLSSLDDFLTWGFIALVVAFCVVTLYLTSGFHKKTTGAVCSALLTVAIIYVLYYFCIWDTNTVPYDLMNYAYGPLPLKDLYKVSVIFGSLGAIMDVCITINSSVAELVSATKDIKVKDLIHSVREIGYDIMGTMVNVMFFSYLSSSLPIVILKIQSGYGVGVLYRYEYIFDIVRFLLAALGIVLAIPISGVIATLFVWKGLKHSK